MELPEWTLLLVVTMLVLWGFSVHKVRTDIEAGEPDVSGGGS